MSTARDLSLLLANVAFLGVLLLLGWVIWDWNRRNRR